ncbi:MAG: hypothetical protein QM690_00630 [Sphingobium sp.]
MIRRLASLALVAATLSLAQPVVAGPPQDELSRFFVWWNGARASGQAFTAQGYAPFLTQDAELILDGHLTATGPAAWASYFETARAKGGDVEIVVPFKHRMRSRGEIYAYHIVRARRPGGGLSCLLTAGHAIIDHGRIARLTMVRHPIDLAGPYVDPLCWRR